MEVVGREIAEPSVALYEQRQVDRALGGVFQFDDQVAGGPVGTERRNALEARDELRAERVDLFPDLRSDLARIEHRADGNRRDRDRVVPHRHDVVVMQEAGLRNVTDRMASDGR